MDYDDILERANALENALQAAAALKAQSGTVDATTASLQTVTTSTDGDENPSKLLTGFHAGMQQQGPSKNKRKKTTPTPAQQAQQPVMMDVCGPSAASGPAGQSNPVKPGTNQAPPLCDQEVASTASKRTKKKSEQDEVIDALDPEMKQVAAAHLQHGKGSSIKCLLALKLENFNSGERDKVKGHAIPGARGSAVIIFWPVFFTFRLLNILLP